MKKNLLFLVAICSVSLATAQITQGTIGNGNFIDWDGRTITDVYGLDFNNDGTLEFNIHSGSFTNDAVSYPGGGETNNVMAENAEAWDYYAMLDENETIDANGFWTGYGDAMLTYEDVIPNSFYIGFRIKYDDGMHYGWAKVSFADETLTWEKCYYNETPNAAIKAGQTSGGTTGIDETEMNIKIITPGNHQLLVNSDNQMTIEVYNLDGRKIIESVTNNTITLPSMGIYVIRTDKFSRKVLVR